jgi:hypothetical protein
MYLDPAARPECLADLLNAAGVMYVRPCADLLLRHVERAKRHQAGASAIVPLLVV